tara:strand:+ start:204 stop:941 length:738 start_codon:yes stop_codon:yes gene_type:complete
MLVRYREPWHITQNRVYGFTDVKTADTMQYDYTFYIDYELKKDPTTDKNEYSKSIFVRPGMHYGLIMKPDLFTICWEFWTEVDGENKYYDISFESDEETFYDNYFVIVRHSVKNKEFTFVVTNKSTATKKTLTQKYEGTLCDYTHAPFNFGIANFDTHIPREHMGYCEYELNEVGLFTEQYSDAAILDMINQNKGCGREAKKMLDKPIFVLNMDEITLYKVWDLSGNCFYLDYNLDLTKKLKKLI